MILVESTTPYVYSRSIAILQIERRRPTARQAVKRKGAKKLDGDGILSEC